MLDLPRRAKTLAFLGGAGCTMLGGLVLWKDAIGGEKLTTIKSNKEIKDATEGKVFVVTGANSGIGKEITRTLAKNKGRVYMACRDLKKCEEVREEIVLQTRNKYVYCRKCDLASFKSVRNFVEEFSKKETQCHVLINNAGVMNCRRMFTEDGIEMHLGTNHMGHFLLTHLLHPYLKAAASDTRNSRVVYLMNLDYRKGEINFQDLNCSQGYKPANAFNQSQLANMLAVNQLSRLWEKDNISVNAAYPGVCSTNIKRHMGVDKSITGNTIANPLLWFLTRTAESGAQTPLFLAVDSSVEKMSGKLFSNLNETNILEVGRNQEQAKKLYAVSKYWTGMAEKEEIIKERL